MLLLELEEVEAEVVVEATRHLIPQKHLLIPQKHLLIPQKHLQVPNE